MAARILDGTQIARAIQTEVAAEVERVKARWGITPGLAAVLVGEDPASQIYVRNKRAACKRVGMHSMQHTLPATATEAELLAIVQQLNADPAVHGILVQLPLPEQIDENRVLGAVDPRKDVDGFHPVNMGLLTLGRPRLVPCTPLGIQEMLRRGGVVIEGAHVVVLGRSNTVGKPTAILLAQKAPGANATVTICHTGSRDLPGLTRAADILIVAMGKPRAVTAEMVRPGATVIDVGMHRLADGQELAGDVDFEAVSRVAGAISPVPGGVGRMTVAMLLYNTLKAAELQQVEPRGDPRPPA